MRAICGAIIAAGALIGLGLTAVGFGIRFQNFGKIPPDDAGVFYATPSLMICLVTSVVGALIGLAIAFLGLAFHHERRYRELSPEYRSEEARLPAGTARV
jgi:hypothetical protein